MDEVVQVAEESGTPLLRLLEEADRAQPQGLISGAVLSRSTETVILVNPSRNSGHNSQSFVAHAIPVQSLSSTCSIPARRKVPSGK